MSRFFENIYEEQKRKKSYLCVGLDPHLGRFPEALPGKVENLFPFLKKIVDHTQEFACCFKPQVAYFSALGAEGALYQIIDHIKAHYPATPVILDSKRNDIGSTAEMYSKEAFDRYQADAITVNPYMGG